MVQEPTERDPNGTKKEIPMAQKEIIWTIKNNLLLDYGSKCKINKSLECYKLIIKEVYMWVIIRQLCRSIPIIHVDTLHASRPGTTSHSPNVGCAEWLPPESTAWKGEREIVTLQWRNMTNSTSAMGSRLTSTVISDLDIMYL